MRISLPLNGGAPSHDRSTPQMPSLRSEARRDNGHFTAHSRVLLAQRNGRTESIFRLAPVLAFLFVRSSHSCNISARCDAARVTRLLRRIIDHTRSAIPASVRHCAGAQRHQTRFVRERHHKSAILGTRSGASKRLKKAALEGGAPVPSFYRS
jgi:hypothetical protein